MKVRLNIPALVLMALPQIPVCMFVLPPLLNAHSTHRNLVGFGLLGLVVLTWLTLGIKVVSRVRTKLALHKLLK